ACAFFKTASGSAAGPEQKLYTRLIPLITSNIFRTYLQQKRRT
ncbi:MAG: hypothetical protein ACI8Q3_002706, partial [Marinomonas primoryensis]